MSEIVFFTCFFVFACITLQFASKSRSSEGQGQIKCQFLGSRRSVIKISLRDVVDLLPIIRDAK